MKKASFLLVLVIFALTSARTQVTDRWTPLDDPKDFINFIIDPVDTNVMYASHSYGICKSNNGGSSWTSIDFISSAYPVGIIQNQINRDTLYLGVIAMGTGGVGLYRSANRGNVWTQVYMDKSVSCLALDPVKPHIIYAGTTYDSYNGDAIGVIKSDHSGEMCFEISNGLGNLEINHLTINHQDSRILFAGTDNGLYKSYDAGENWHSITSGLPGGAVISHITISPSDTNIVFAGTHGDGLFKSTDGGNNWSASGTGITNSMINWITINPANPERIYASVNEAGVFRSLNSGATWSQMDQTGISFVYNASTIRLNPLNPDIVYALFGDGSTSAQIYCRLEDFSPPAIPTNLKGESNDHQVTISWKPNTEPDLDKYKIYRDSVLLDSIIVTGPEDTVYTDTGLVNEQSYRYMVTAVDEDGYESDYSEELIIAPYPNPLGLIAYYPFDGNAFDSSGNGNSGAVTDCIEASNRYNETNTCYDFNGTSSYVNCANFPMQNITEQISLMAWIYLRSVNDTTYIISKSHLCENLGNYNLRLIPDKKIEFAYKDGTGTDLAYQTEDTLQLNRWTHIGLTYDYITHDINLFIDTRSAPGDWTDPGPPQNQQPVTTYNDLCIGSARIIDGYCYGKTYGDPVKFFDGLIDEVYIYNTLLNKEEIKSIASPGPKALTNLEADHCNGTITLTDTSYIPVNVELYRIYRDDQSPSETIYDSVYAPDVSDTLYQDFAAYGQTLYYRITAVDSTGFESAFSNEVAVDVKKAVDLGPDTSICANQYLQLDAGSEFISYEWSVGGETGQYLEITETGEYRVKVTGNNGSCISYDTIHVTIYEVPEVDLGPDRWLCPGSSIVLRAPAGFEEYHWSIGATTESIIVSEPGIYNVTVTEGGICDGFDEIQISLLETYQDQKICLVTVDPATDKLIVIWEKPVGKGIEYFKIYREGDMIGDYQLKAMVPYDDLSIFHDTESSPGNQQYLYKISIVDSCGNESDMSPYHKTLLLQFTGSVGGVNLGWSEYEVEDGFISFGSYDIYKGTNSASLTPVKTVSASLDRYIDTDPQAMTALYYYRIAGVLIEPCLPSGNSKADPEPFTRSLSNIEDNKYGTFIVNSNDLPDFSVQPNPFTDHTMIRFSNPDLNEFDLFISDISGRVVRKIKYITSNQYELKRENLPSGIYLLELRGEKIYRSKIIIE